VFLQITADTAEDLSVPGQRYSFGTIELAQARGDFEVLASRGRRLLRVHLKDVTRGLRTLHAAVRDALG
jgi:transaldolase/glucose-6-phosphate isomerase